MKQNPILDKIEAEQVRTLTPFNVGDTVRVQKTFPFSSPFVDKVEVIRKGKVRRAKLNYLRKLSGKAAKVKEVIK